MRRGEGTGWGDEREQGKGRGEAAGAAGWAGEAQGQEEGRGRSSGVGIYLEGWGRGGGGHSRIHPLAPCCREEIRCGLHESGFTFQLRCMLTSSVALGEIPNPPRVNWACV